MQFHTKYLFRNLPSLNIKNFTKNSSYLHQFVVSKHFSSENDFPKKMASPFLSRAKIQEISFEDIKTKKVSIKISEEISLNEKPKDNNQKKRGRSKKSNKSSEEAIIHIQIKEKFVENVVISEKEIQDGPSNQATEVNIPEEVVKKMKYKKKERSADSVLTSKTFAGSAGIKAVEISRIQNLADMKMFLKKPQNIILSLNEKTLIYERLAKIIWNLNDNFKREEVDDIVKNFFSKFLAAIQASENHKVYLNVLSIPIPKVLIYEFEDFYAKCLNDLIFNFPKLKSEELLSIYSTLQKFYFNVIMKPEYEKQIEKSLSLFEDRLHLLNHQQKNNILRLMTNFRVFNHRILDFMLYYSEMNFAQLGYEDLLSIIRTNINARKVVPYELIYRLRNKFNESFKDLKPTIIARTLSLFSKLRLFFIEPFYEKIFQRLNEDATVKALSVFDSVLILNSYAKAKYRDEEIFEKYLNKIRKNLGPLNRIYMKILLLLLADINYPNKDIFSELYKHYNILSLINEIKLEKDISQFDKDYLQTVHDLIVSQLPEQVEPLQEKETENVPDVLSNRDVDLDLDVEIEAANSA